MSFSPRKILLTGGLILMMSTQSTSAAILTATGIQTQARPVIASIRDAQGKLWAKTQFDHYAKTFIEIQRRQRWENNTEALKPYRSSIAQGASQLIADIKSGSYVFGINESDRKSIESTVVGYQSEFATALEFYVDAYMNKGSRETGDIHLTLKSKEANIEVNLDPYKITISKDRKNIELDAKLTFLASEPSGSKKLNFTIDGNIKLIGNDLYLTLRDATVNTVGDTDSLRVDLDNFLKVIQALKGKTYHKKLDSEFGNILAENGKNSQDAVTKIRKMTTILKSESLLTPIAKKGNEYILALKTKTFHSLVAIFDPEDTLDTSVMKLIDVVAIPADLRTDGKNLSIKGFSPEYVFDAVLARSSDNTPVLTLNTKETGVNFPWQWTLSKTPTFWALAGSVTGDGEVYQIDSKASKTGANASVKKDGKTIATAKIDNTGINAWSYDMSAFWEHDTYSGEKNTYETDSIAMRLWGTLRDEFGDFQLVPPSLSEELDTAIQKLEAKK